MKKLLFDENLAPFFLEQLLRREPGLVVRRVGGVDAPPTGTADPEILRWCERHQFLLVTNNRRTMPAHLAEHMANGGHAPGVLLLDLEVSAGRILDGLLAVARAPDEDEYMDRVGYIPLK